MNWQEERRLEQITPSTPPPPPIINEGMYMGSIHSMYMVLPHWNEVSVSVWMCVCERVCDSQQWRPDSFYGCSLVLLWTSLTTEIPGWPTFRCGTVHTRTHTHTPLRSSPNFPIDRPTQGSLVLTRSALHYLDSDKANEMYTHTDRHTKTHHRWKPELVWTAEIWWLAEGWGQTCWVNELQRKKKEESRSL